MKKIKVINKDDTKPMPVEVLAESIKAISDGVRKLMNGPLNDKAIFILIQNAAPSVGGRYGAQKIGLTEIRAVLEGMDLLEATYLKRKVKIS